MQISDQVASQSEALLNGAVTGSASSERECFTLSFQKDWGSEMISDILKYVQKCFFKFEKSIHCVTVLDCYYRENIFYKFILLLMSSL
jgi:hypothetical protein